MMENQQLSTVNAFVAALHAAGVKDVCISPGSRSTPLTMALARQQKLKIWSLLDERSAGFFAVGIARATLSPVALVCTSGTATANYYPAVMEAYHARLPLIVLTADRPAELRDTGSNQTVDQVKMFGGNLKWQAELPVPDGTKTLSAHAVMMARRAIAAACTAPNGPVHVNLPFREPLIPPYADVSDTEAELVDGTETARSATWHTGVKRLAPGAVKFAVELLRRTERPMIVCGPLTSGIEADAIQTLAFCTGAPIFADVLSQIRTRGDEDSEYVIDTYDVWLAECARLKLPSPDCILRFGAVPTSKALGQYLQEHSNVPQLLIDDSYHWRDPFYTATHVFQCDALEFVTAVREELDMVSSGVEDTWLTYWQNVNHVARTKLDEAFHAGDWHEAGVVAELAKLVPDEASLFIGNSMPIRDFDSFLGASDKHVHIHANRGASGIDGVVSSAMGVSAATVAPTILVIGDVSFYHDLNGLLVAARHQLDLLVVLIHNDGGGIFSFLPQAAYEDTFDQFRTAHGIDFAPAVAMYGGTFTRVDTWQALRTAVADGLRAGGLCVVEVPTEPGGNVAWHKQVRTLVANAVEECAWSGKLCKSEG